MLFKRRSKLIAKHQLTSRDTAVTVACATRTPRPATTRPSTRPSTTPSKAPVNAENKPAPMGWADEASALVPWPDEPLLPGAPLNGALLSLTPRTHSEAAKASSQSTVPDERYSLGYLLQVLQSQRTQKRGRVLMSRRQLRHSLLCAATACSDQAHARPSNAHYAATSTHPDHRSRVHGAVGAGNLSSDMAHFTSLALSVWEGWRVVVERHQAVRKRSRWHYRRACTRAMVAWEQWTRVQKHLLHHIHQDQEHQQSARRHEHLMKLASNLALRSARSSPGLCSICCPPRGSLCF